MKKKEYSIDEALKHFRERKLAFEKLAEALTKMSNKKRQIKNKCTRTRGEQKQQT
ncbi:MAG: hypothetical protein K9H16_09405 [Bacteroidales bacterium]|nr:hypothetical protein [Bacteroidales bacterium]